VHRVVWRVGSYEALDFWAERSAARAARLREQGRACVSPIRGHSTRGRRSEVTDEKLRAEHQDGAGRRWRCRGFNRRLRLRAAQHAGTAGCPRSAIEFEPVEEVLEERGERRGGLYLYEERPRALACRGRQPSTTVAGNLRSRTRGMGESGDRGRRAAEEGDPTSLYSARSTSRSRAAVLFEIAAGPALTVRRDAGAFWR